MSLARRELLALVLQGIASRGFKPLPRGNRSGLPWDSRFDRCRGCRPVLRAPGIYGVDRKTYIIETAGPGAAFFDYDNDGWLDILLLSGTSLVGTPGGGHEPAVSE